VAASKRRDRRIQPGEPPKKGRIDPGDPSQLGEITFSFKYLRSDPPVRQNFPDGYLDELLKCLKAFSERQKGEVVGSRNPSLRAHGIDWSKSNVPNGFDHLPSHLRDIAGFQLTVRREQYGRIIGFLSGTVFYVCWLDPNHETMGI
jgi:hypothetical protein